jgi:hypothetical protein
MLTFPGVSTEAPFREPPEAHGKDPGMDEYESVLPRKSRTCSSQQMLARMGACYRSQLIGQRHHARGGSQVPLPGAYLPRATTGGPSPPQHRPERGRLGSFSKRLERVRVE